MTLTTEQIEQVIDDCRKGAAMRGLFNKWIVEEIASELLRCLDRLAELSASANREEQPVAYMNKFSGVCMTLEQQPNAADDAGVYVPLYTAPPAPAVNASPDFEAWFNSPEAGLRVVNFHIQHELQLKAWNACLAAMLENIDKPPPRLDSVVTRHTDQPVSGGYKLVPVDFLTTASRLIDLCRTYSILSDGGNYKERTISECESTMEVIDGLLTAAPESGNG